MDVHRLARGGVAQESDGGDTIAPHRDVALESWVAAAIDDPPVLQDQVVSAPLISRGARHERETDHESRPYFAHVLLSESG